MKETLATITSKGQVTIPAEVRRYLGVTTSDRIAFVVGPKGGVIIKVPRYRDVNSLAGAAGSHTRPLAGKQMREIAYDRLEEKYAKRK
jgi:AbrB family looped-hinge helix DNA binding protein